MSRVQIIDKKTGDIIEELVRFDGDIKAFEEEVQDLSWDSDDHAYTALVYTFNDQHFLVIDDRCGANNYGVWFIAQLQPGMYISVDFIYVDEDAEVGAWFAPSFDNSRAFTQEELEYLYWTYDYTYKEVSK
jgi:hypothetical protein